MVGETGLFQPKLGMLINKVKVKGNDFLIQTELVHIKGEQKVITHVFHGGRVVASNQEQLDKGLSENERKKYLILSHKKAFVKLLRSINKEENLFAQHTKQTVTASPADPYKRRIAETISALGKLKGAMGAVAITREGETIASSFKEKISPEKIGIFVVRVVEKSINFLETASFGAFNALTIESRKGKLYITTIPRGDLLALLGNAELKYGMARLELSRAGSTLSRIYSSAYK